MPVPPELRAQILRYYHVEQWRVGTIIAFHFTCRQCPSLCFQIDLGVDIRRRQRYVSKPTAYRVDVDSGLEQQRGSRVSYDMRVHVLSSQ
jgi:hypothetical protein